MVHIISVLCYNEKNPFDYRLTTFLRNPKDTIAEQLAQQYIPQFYIVNIQLSINPSPLDNLNFLWYENGIFYVTIKDKDSPNSNKNYQRIITVECMPPNTNLPEGLLELLKRHEYKEIKMENLELAIENSDN